MQRNNRMEKTIDLFKKTADTKETFHIRMGMINDRKAEKQGIKMRWQEYTEELHKVLVTWKTMLMWSLT